MSQSTPGIDGSRIHAAASGAGSVAAPGAVMAAVLLPFQPGRYCGDLPTVADLVPATAAKVHEPVA